MNCEFNLQTKHGITNMSIGGIVQTDRRMSELTASTAYMYYNMVYAIPKGRPYTPFEKLFFPMDTLVWALLGVFFAFALILLIWLREKLPAIRNIIVGLVAPHKAPILNMVNIFFGGPLLFVPQTKTALQLVMIWVIATLVLRTAYQGLLFNMLQSDMTYPPPDTLEDIRKSDLNIYTTTTFFNIMYKNVPDFRNRLLVYDPVPSTYDVLRNSTFNGVFVVAVDTMAAYNRKHRQNGTISMAKDRIFLLPVSIFFTRSSCLEPAFNDQLQKYISSGLFSSWTKQFIDHKYSKEIRKTSNEPEKLSVHQITGILIILFAVYGISILVFIIELLSVKYHLIRRTFYLL